MVSKLDDTMRQTAIANRILSDVGLAVGVTAALGHVSIRVPGDSDKFVVKGRQYEVDALAVMRPEDMVVCDLEGFLVQARPGLSQCSEVKIHSCIYKTRPEVHSVVHVHPRYTVLMSALGQTLVPMCQEGAQLVRRPLPVYPHTKTIQSDEEGMEMVSCMGSEDILLLQGHGAVTTGATAAESVMSMMQLEEQARMNYLAYCAEGPDHSRLPDELVEEMSNRIPLHELPHFSEVLQGKEPQRDGIWNYWVVSASRDL